ncbi:sulfatase-like hydrolase/transferase [Planctomycetota bacterium]
MNRQRCICFATATMVVIASQVLSAPIERPNILWLTSEDNGTSWVSCYGSKNANTPIIDQLAKEGFRYTHCYDNAAVCAPTRSSWITGMNAVSNGTQPMRSRNDIPHDRIKYYPDLLKQAGYFVSNYTKTDYNIGGRKDKACWDDSKTKFAWRQRKPGQPFFCVMNTTISHESKAHRPYVPNEKLLDGAETMELFSYHPDLPEVRNNYLQYAQAIARMDQEIGSVLDELKKDGLYEDTIIIYNSDHGGVMPRSKRFLYASGIHCPLVVRIPAKYKPFYPAEKPGMTVDRLVSFIDMPKTWLSLAGAEIPETFQGTIFLGKGMEPEPKYHFAFRERADERLDCVRVLRDKQFAYHINYMPYAPTGQFLGYLWKGSVAPAWEKHHREGKTNEITGRFFTPRVSEEFYDNVADFDNVHNLIDVPEYATKIETLKRALRKHQLDIYDSGLLPEQMRMRRAEAHHMTIYDMVRDPKLYPLESYLDAADRSLERKPENIDIFVKGMKHSDSGIRWWSVVGLLLLEKDAAPAKAVLQEALRDKEDEIRMMAAWSLVKSGEEKQGLMALEEMLFGNCGNVQMLHNIIDWMGAPGLPLAKKYIDKDGSRNGDYNSVSILGHVADINGW